MDVKGGGDMSGHIFMQGLDSSRTRYAVPNDSKPRKRQSPCPAHAPIMIPRTFPRVGWGGLIAKQIISLRLCGETRTNTHAQTYKLLSSLHNMPHRPQIHATVLVIYIISCPTTSHGCKGGRGHAWTHFHARNG